jgi:lysozyme family protein
MVNIIIDRENMTPKQIKAIYNKRYYNKLKDNNLNNSVECEICRGRYNRYSVNRHNRSKRHLKFLNNLETNI